MPAKKKVMKVGADAQAARDVSDVEDIDLMSDEVDTSNATVYNSLREAVAKKAVKPNIKLTIPNRPAIKLEFDPNIEFDVYQAWMNKATRGKKTPDFLRLAMQVIAYSNRAVIFNGQPAESEDGSGRILTVRSEELHDMLGAPIGSVQAAIKELYGSDGHIIQTLHKITDAAGYSVDGDVEEDEDASPLDD